MAQTLRDRYIIGLQRMGCVHVKDTFRYKVYSRPKGGFYYVGRSGSLRIGATAQNSLPCSQTFKDLLLAQVPAVSPTHSDRVALN